MIKVLEKSVASKIAAGEVVERPLSVVKELVENSIDAGAGSITVEIKNGGKSYIRVSDDGCGIDDSETEIAFYRHATSKIKEVSDLESIETLGFRGEALASIAAVSRVELLTKCHGREAGTRVLIHGGEVIGHSAFGCPEGTTMIVADLFYNTPARLKFMKADNAESSMITDFVSQIALAYPNIRFRMINNGNILFSTTGSGKLQDAIYTVYGKAVGQDLVEVNLSEDYLRVYGFVSAPMNSRTSRRHQIFFVNGRVISSKIIERGINRAYADRLFKGRFPICFLFLEMNGDKLDVNIHPNKREVRFDDENFVADTVYTAVRKALAGKDAMAQVHSENIRTFSSFENEGIVKGEQERISELTAAKSPLSTPSYEEANKPGRCDDALVAGEKCENAIGSSNSGFTGTATAEIDSISRIENTESEKKAEYIQQNKIIEKLPQNRQKEEQVYIKKLLSSLRENEKKYIEKNTGNRFFDFEKLRPISSVFATYILAADDDTFYMIDQHAAHERVFFEKLLAEFMAEDKHVQPSMIPVIINVTPAVAAKDEEWLEILRGFGFDIEAFGPDTYKISAVPMFMDLAEAEDFVNDFLDHLDDAKDFSDLGQLGKIITRSCKSAVKGNDTLHDEEIRELLSELSKCENPYSCPHGRPTFVRFSRYELEKFFKRIQ